MIYLCELALENGKIIFPFFFHRFGNGMNVEGRQAIALNKYSNLTFFSFSASEREKREMLNDNNIVKKCMQFWIISA